MSLDLRQGLRANRRDGSEFPVMVGLTAVDTRAGTMILASVVEQSPA